MMTSSPKELDMEEQPPLVADVMSIDPIVVRVDASLEEADHVLRSTYITGIPVVNSNGVLVGVISHVHLTAYRFAHRQPRANGTRPDPRRGTDEPSGGHRHVG
jgi:CBS-domain-containing membrane protein